MHILYKIVLLTSLSFSTFAQIANVQYRFINTPYYFSISCAGSSTPADNCGITYHNRIPESYISTDIPHLTTNFHEVDDNGKKLGKFTFQDNYTGYYLRFKDKKKMLFRAVQSDDFMLYPDFRTRFISVNLLSLS